MSKIIQFPTNNKDKNSDSEPRSKNGLEKKLWLGQLALVVVSCGGLMWSFSAKKQQARGLSSLGDIKSTEEINKELQGSGAEFWPSAEVTKLDTFKYEVLKGNYNLDQKGEKISKLELQLGKMPIKANPASLIARYKSVWSLDFAQVEKKSSGLYLLKDAKGHLVGKAFVSSKEGHIQSIELRK